MKPFMHIFQLRVCDMGIDLRRPEIFMPEHFLHRAQISTISKKIGRKRMPERVRRWITDDPRLKRVLLDDVPDGNA